MPAGAPAETHPAAHATRHTQEVPAGALAETHPAARAAQRESSERAGAHCKRGAHLWERSRPARSGGVEMIGELEKSVDWTSAK